MAEGNGNQIDYRAALADLEARRAALDALIASLRAAMPALMAITGSQSAEMAGTLTAFEVPPMLGTSMEVPAGAFFKKSIVEATKLYLSLVKKKRTTPEIVEALRQGGMESTSKDFEKMVGVVLYRASKNAETGIIKLTDAWGLSEWYPPGFRPTRDDPGAKTKKSKTRKPKKAKSKSPIGGANITEMPKAAAAL